MADAPDDDVPTASGPPILARRYRIEGMIGHGGMGTVYRARDVELGEVVALKILRDVGAASLERFRDEVRLARRVSHKNVARTFDIGDHGGAPFLTMEYVAGESLRRILARGRVSSDRAADLAAQICAGVDAIHEQSIAHGDLKPENVLVSSAGVAKLADFGLARAASRTDRGHLAGTLEYMAPEQLEGAPPDRASDIYALGVLLYELLTGDRPWGRLAKEDMIARKLFEPPAPGKDVPSIVGECLARDPTARPRAAGDVAARLTNRARVPAPIGSTPRLGAASARGGRLSVAVRALRAEDPGETYLGVAFASDVVRMLAASPELEVRGAVLRPDEEADTDAVVEGTVRRRGMEVQLGLRVVSTLEGFLLWARSSRVSLTDVLGELDSAARAVATTLTATPAPRASAVALMGPETLDRYLRARAADDESWHDATHDNAPMYEELLASAPDDPLLLASFALSLLRTAMFFPARHGRARAAVEKALLGAPELAEAHAALGLVLYFANEIEDAIRAMVRALALSPSLPDPQSVLGSVSSDIGLDDEGLERLELAMRLAPQLRIAWSHATRLCELRGDRARADALLAGAPVPTGAVDGWLYWLTRVRIAIGRGSAEAEELARAFAATPMADAPPFAWVTRALRREGTAAETAQGLAMLSPPDALSRPRSTARLVHAEISAWLGDWDAAEASIRAADGDAFIDALWLDRCPLLEPLRARPAFLEVRAHVSARAARIRDVARQLGLTRS